MNKFKKAFTIVETLLSMAGLSIIILIIGYMILQIINTYQKGISLRDVNKTADQIINDMQSAIVESGGIKCAFKENNKDGIMTTKSGVGETCASLYETDKTKISAITGAALCTGRYSYIWNYGDALQKIDKIADPSDKESAMKKLFRYKKPDGSIKLVRMIKIEDLESAYCSNGSPLRSGLPDVISENDINLSDNSKINELIESNERQLALHSFLVSRTSSDQITNQSLYEVEFVLGTFNNDLLLTSDAQCKNYKQATTAKVRSDGSQDTSELVARLDLSYCAVNKFNFAARGLKGKGEW